MRRRRRRRRRLLVLVLVLVLLQVRVVLVGELLPVGGLVLVRMEMKLEHLLLVRVLALTPLVLWHRHLVPEPTRGTRRRVVNGSGVGRIFWSNGYLRINK